ncbi:MAG TPA: hypothetical protein DCM86_05270, partial [Verrucomicrobiales bacterium]|nr:hypothetical protein [Verrucomicrobiales bacterium]
MAPARSRHIIPMFLIVLALAFISQTWPYWRSGRLLPGTHADGAFHYYSELARLSPSLFPNDLAVTSNRNLGYYEHFYRGLGWIARATGLGLLNTNMLVCWLGNALYLLGVMRVLDRLGLPPLWCAVGTLLAAQVYVLLAMWSGVVHSVAIPREFWLWPLPWFLAWFLGGARSGPELLLFYGALGLTYAMTYPLWAALFGLAFGLGDLWRLAQAPSAAGFLWLGLAGGVCLLLVALPSLTMLHVVSRDGSAISE